MKKYIVDEHTGWKYELVGDYYLPIGTRFEDATTDDADPCSAETNTPSGEAKKPEPDRLSIGRFGRAHGEYLKRTQRHVYSQFIAEGRLGSYLVQINEQANAMLDLLIRQMAEREGVTEQLKAADQMEWVRRMNSICNRAEEIVNSELIYA